VENYRTENNRNSDKKKKNETGLDTHYVKQQEQLRKLHWLGILRGIEEEVGRRERGEGHLLTYLLTYLLHGAESFLRS
jgi:hypothetical protein